MSTRRYSYGDGIADFTETGGWSASANSTRKLQLSELVQSAPAQHMQENM